MRSPLPPGVYESLVQVAQAVDQRLQATGFRIPVATGVDDAFDEGWVESVLLRALMGAGFNESALPNIIDLGNGGRELKILEGGRDLRFRMKYATRDRLGELRVLASSDSVLSRGASRTGTLSLFPEQYPDVIHQWLLAFVIDRETWTLEEVVAARPIGFISRAPGRLRLDSQIGIPLLAPSVRRFVADDDDLEFGDGADEKTPDL